MGPSRVDGHAGEVEGLLPRRVGQRPHVGAAGIGDVVEGARGPVGQLLDVGQRGLGGVEGPVDGPLDGAGHHAEATLGLEGGAGLGRLAPGPPLEQAADGGADGGPFGRALGDARQRIALGVRRP